VRPPAHVPAAAVDVAMTICGNDVAPLAEAAIRSLHHSTRRFGYDVNLYALHDDSAGARRLAKLWSAAAAANMTRVYIAWVLIDSHAPGAQRFRLCSTTRLALPKLLPELDVLVYLDVDTLVVGDLSRLAALAKRFNATQWAAFAAEDGSWYTSERYRLHTGRMIDGSGRKKTHVPFREPTGLNAGVFVTRSVPSIAIHTVMDCLRLLTIDSNLHCHA